MKVFFIRLQVDHRNCSERLLSARKASDIRPIPESFLVDPELSPAAHQQKPACSS